jgi:D-alanyl-lipoteichoic acid acyltransferase DltB (MBOAT superfamily)
MLFNSFEFAVFLPLIFILYWMVFNRSSRSQNLLLVSASLFFYGWADLHFLALLIFVAFFNFRLGLAIAKGKTEKIKRNYLRMGLLTNIGILGYFKYFNFFYAGFLKMLGTNSQSFQILLPLGISFFIFQVIGYIIDIYNEEIEPCTSPLNFLTYVAFFPKLFAGPIERAQNFLPQIEKKREFDYNIIADGLRQFLWGLFTKLVIADNAATIANKIFDNYNDYSGSTLLLGAFFYAFQVYCDFSGYSNMAIGVSKLFGIELMQNFATPFFSTNIGDYWKKWHISLSSWMMNYVFTPLSFAFRRFKKKGLIISIIITFVIVGLWHGANWTFIVFGLLHGLYFIPLILKNSMSKSSIVAQGKSLPSIKEFFLMLGLFILVMLTMIVFRTETVSLGVKYFGKLFSQDLFSAPVINDKLKTYITLFFIIFLIVVEWIQREKQHALQFEKIKSVYFSKPVRWSIYCILILFMFCFKGNDQDFIYFKF